MKDHKLVLPALLCLLLPAAGCVAPSPPAPPAAGAAPTSAQAGGQTIVAISPAPAPQQTLPQWLGINDLFTGMGGLIQAKHQLFGMLFPQLSTAMAGLEPPPAIKSLTDPANMGPNAPPGVKDVAQVKADEDAAPQKIAAIKYAAGIGCVKGHPGIERAFLAFLDDPTEEVRYEAAKGLAEMTGTPCETCPKGSCCTPKIYKKLSDIVTREKSPGCYVEYSDRVRRMARLAMHNCGAPPPEPKKAPDQIEGPDRKPLPKKEKIEGPVPPPAPGITAAQTKTETAEPGVVQASHQKAFPETPVPVPAGPQGQTAAILVQWERVSVPFANFSSHKDAFAAVGYLRARVLGAKLIRNPGFRKEQVSVQTFDWTDLDTVTPSVLARTLKTLPIGQVSPVLKDRHGYHLVRVLQRQYRSGQPPSQAVPHPPVAASQAGPIIQAGGVKRTSNAHGPDRRVTDEQWPPDLSRNDLLQPAQKFPSTSEREARPPLPKPDPRPHPVAPDATPGSGSPSGKQPASKPKPMPATPPTPDQEKQTQPDAGPVFGNTPHQRSTSSVGHKPFDLKRGGGTAKPIIDLRGRKPAPQTQTGAASAFPAGNVAMPIRPRRETIQGFDPFPADHLPPNRVVPRRNFQSDIAAPSGDSRVFGDDLEPIRPAVKPPSRQQPQVQAAPGRFHLPKAAITHSEPLPRYSEPRATAPRTNSWNASSSNARNASRQVVVPIQPVPEEPAQTRQANFEIPEPRLPSQTEQRSGLEYRHPVDVQPESMPRRSRADQTPIRPLPPLSSQRNSEPETRDVQPKPKKPVLPIQPAPLPDPKPAAIEPPQVQPPQPRRRGNLTIQTGRPTPVREISYDIPRDSQRRTRKAETRKPAHAPASQLATRNAQLPTRKVGRTVKKSAGSRNRTGGEIRYVPIGSLRSGERRSGSPLTSTLPAARDSAVDSRRSSVSRKAKPKVEHLYFSRSGKRDADDTDARNADRE